MMSTNLGTPPYEYFLLIFRRISFNETLWLSSWALMSSAAIPDVTRRRVSAWDGPIFPGMSDQQGDSVQFTDLQSLFVVPWSVAEQLMYVGVRIQVFSKHIITASGCHSQGQIINESNIQRTT